MVKHFVPALMAGFFTRQRFGRPQFLAGALLLLFLAQAIWLVHSELRASESSGLSASEQVRIAAGWRQIHGGRIAGAPFPDALFPDAPGSLPLEISRDDSGFDTEHSPLISLVTAAPLLAWPHRLSPPNLTGAGFLAFHSSPLESSSALRSGMLPAASAETPEASSPSPSTVFLLPSFKPPPSGTPSLKSSLPGDPSDPSSPPSQSPTLSMPRAKSFSGTGAAFSWSASPSPSPSAPNSP